MKKCRYCGKELDSNLEFCSNECENSYRKIIENDRHKIKYFIFCIILFLHIKKAPLRACKGANFILLRFISQKYHSCFQTFRLGKS